MTPICALCSPHPLSPDSQHNFDSVFSRMTWVLTGLNPAFEWVIPHPRFSLMMWVLIRLLRLNGSFQYRRFRHVTLRIVWKMCKCLKFVCGVLHVEVAGAGPKAGHDEERSLTGSVSSGHGRFRAEKRPASALRAIGPPVASVHKTCKTFAVVRPTIGRVAATSSAEPLHHVQLPRTRRSRLFAGAHVIDLMLVIGRGLGHARAKIDTGATPRTPVDQVLLFVVVSAIFLSNWLEEAEDCREAAADTSTWSVATHKRWVTCSEWICDTCNCKGAKTLMTDPNYVDGIKITRW